MIVVGGVGIDVSIAMDLEESVKEMHKEITKQKIVFIVTEMATEDVTNVMVQEQDFQQPHFHGIRNKMLQLVLFTPTCSFDRILESVNNPSYYSKIFGKDDCFIICN